MQKLNVSNSSVDNNLKGALGSIRLLFLSLVPGSVSQSLKGSGLSQQHRQQPPASWKPHFSDVGGPPAACSYQPPSSARVQLFYFDRAWRHAGPPGLCGPRQMPLPGWGTAANIQPASKVLLASSPGCEGDWRRVWGLDMEKGFLKSKKKKNSMTD